MVLEIFFVCSVLNKDLSVEKGALVWAYYYYVATLGNSSETPERWEYIKDSYPRLSEWIIKNQRRLEKSGKKFDGAGSE